MDKIAPETIAAVLKWQPKHLPGQHDQSTHGNWAKGGNIMDKAGLESFADGLPDVTTTGREWGVRFTNDWPKDKKRGISFADWGYSPGVTRAEVERDFPGNKVVYSRAFGGWMPVLEGLSTAGGDQNARVALDKALSSRYGSGYDKVVIFEGRLTGFGTDGEDLLVPTGPFHVFQNPVK